MDLATSGVLLSHMKEPSRRLIWFTIDVGSTNTVRRYHNRERPKLLSTVTLPVRESGREDHDEIVWVIFASGVSQRSGLIEGPRIVPRALMETVVQFTATAESSPLRHGPSHKPWHLETFSFAPLALE